MWPCLPQTSQAYRFDWERRGTPARIALLAARSTRKVRAGTVRTTLPGIASPPALQLPTIDVRPSAGGPLRQGGGRGGRPAGAAGGVGTAADATGISKGLHSGTAGKPPEQLKRSAMHLVVLQKAERRAWHSQPDTATALQPSRADGIWQLPRTWRLEVVQPAPAHLPSQHRGRPLEPPPGWSGGAAFGGTLAAAPQEGVCRPRFRLVRNRSLVDNLDTAQARCSKAPVERIWHDALRCAINPQQP